MSASPLDHICISTLASPSKQAHHFSSTTGNIKFGGGGGGVVVGFVGGLFCFVFLNKSPKS